MHNRLPNPPHRVRDELDATRGVEAFGCLDQADIALIDEISKRQATADVLASHADDITQVTANELIKRLLIPRLGTGCQLDLFLTREQRDLLDFLEVGLKGIPCHCVAVASILCHTLIPS